MVSTKKRQKRRSFSNEQKAKFVHMFHSGELTVAQLAQNVGVSKPALGRWIRKLSANDDGTKTVSGQAEDREEIARLRKENRQLRAERDVQEKSIAFFAREDS